MIPHDLTHAIGWSTLHFLWQGAAIGLLAALTLAATPRRHAHARYLVACAALALCAVTFLTTLSMTLRPAPASLDHLVALRAAPPAPAMPAAPAATAALTTLDIVAWLWISGVLALTLRLALQYLAARRLTTCRVTEPDSAWLATFAAIRADLRIRRHVRLVCSPLIEAPMVVGWFAPVVLAPASAFTSLTPEQLRAVLVHELAHIRRHDHVINAAQVVIETLLFFHPVTWWLSRRIRIEREHCCDDATVRATSQPRVFAEALARLELARHTHPQAALAANGGPLMDRIARIIGHVPPRRRSPLWSSAVGVAAGLVLGAAGLAYATGRGEPPQDEEMLRMLRQVATTSDADDQDLRGLYDAFVFQGSTTQLAMEEHVAALRAKFDAAVENGRLTPGEASAHLDAAIAEVQAKADAQFLIDVFEYTPGEAWLTVTRAGLERQVDAGALTREEAEAKLAEVSRGISLREEWRRLTEAKGAALRQAIAAGEMTEEEGRRQMRAFEIELKQRMELNQAQVKLDALVQAGELTREEADERMAAHRRKLNAEGGPAQVDWTVLKTRVEGAVERGDLTREEAERIYKRAAAGAERADPRAARIANALTEAGIPEEKLRTATSAVLKLAAVMGKETDAATAEARVNAWLGKEGFTPAEIEVVTGMARRVASATR